MDNSKEQPMENDGLLRSIKRWWYKKQNYSSFYAVSFGKFRVLYPDGKRSIPMNYKTAKDYAEIFGGKVIDNF